MTGSRTLKLTLIVAFLFSIFFVGLVQSLIEMSQKERPLFLDVFLRQPTQKNLRAYETALEKNSWFSNQLQPWMRLFQFVVLKETGEKALLGKEGWFYYRPEVRYLIEPLPAPRKPDNPDNEILQAALDFRDQLKARGIDLIVVPAWGKSSVYPDGLVSTAVDSNPPVYAHTQNAIAMLRKNGIEVFDLMEAFRNARMNNSQPGLYLAQDTHWSPAGVHVGAKALAEFLLRKGVVVGSADYRLKDIPLRRNGDVLKMMDIPLTTRMYPPEVIVCHQVVVGENGQPYKDDPAASILIIGDSFLRIFERDEPKSAGFISHLAYELKQPLTSIVSDGGASTIVRQELARKPELLANKKILIWEVVDRDVRSGTEGWQKVTLRG